MKTTHEVYYIREGFIQSIVSDLVTFGFLVGSVWFNMEFVGGSYFLNGVILIMFIFWIIGKGKSRIKKFNSNEELIKYLQEQKD